MQLNLHVPKIFTLCLCAFGCMHQCWSPTVDVMQFGGAYTSTMVLTWTALWEICNQGNTLYKKLRNKYRLCHRWREREWLHVISLQYQARKAQLSDVYLLYKQTKPKKKPLWGRGIQFEERGWEDSIWGWAYEDHCNEYRKKRRKHFRFA